MKACPHCGSEDDGFVMTGTVHGPVTAFFRGDGKYTDLSYDHSYTRMNKTIRCGKCFKPRRDVVKADLAIVEKPCQLPTMPRA